MDKIKGQFRQGDVLIEACAQAEVKGTPQDAKNGRAILAEGEATGHAHACAGGALLEVDTHTAYLTAGPETASVVHEEHATIPLAPAQPYKVTRQREWSDEDEIRVSD